MILMMDVSSGNITFIVPKKGYKKYIALIQTNGKIKRVSFGDRRYQHYRDIIGHWNHLDHNDEKPKN